jgi:hypothetical protein
VGVQVLGGRIEHGGTVENRGMTKPFRALSSRPAVTSLVSDFCGLDGPSFEKLVRSRHQRRFAAATTDCENTAGRRIGGGLVTNRTQKSAVNPLTRHASRSVIQRNYQSPHVEGPAATFDPCLTDL